MSIQALDDLLVLVDLESSPRCETLGAEDVHGDGEDAVALLKMPCPACQVVDSCLIGQACIDALEHFREGNYTHACETCGHDVKVREFVLLSF